MSASGLSDPDKLAAARALADSFKSGKHKDFEPSKRAQVAKPPGPAKSLPPRPGQRDYNGLGAFVPSGHGQGQRSVIGSAGLDFLSRRDIAEQPPATTTVVPSVSTDGKKPEQEQALHTRALTALHEPGTAIPTSTLNAGPDPGLSSNPFMFPPKPKGLPPGSILEHFYSYLTEADELEEKVEDIKECLIDLRVQDDVPSEPREQETTLENEWFGPGSSDKNDGLGEPQKAQVVRPRSSDVEKLQWGAKIKRKPVASSAAVDSVSLLKRETSADVIVTESQPVAIVAENPKEDTTVPVESATEQLSVAFAPVAQCEETTNEPKSAPDQVVYDQKPKLSAQAPSFSPEQKSIQENVAQEQAASYIPASPSTVQQWNASSCAYNAQTQTSILPPSSGAVPGLWLNPVMTTMGRPTAYLLIPMADVTPFTMQQSFEDRAVQPQMGPQLTPQVPVHLAPSPSAPVSGLVPAQQSKPARSAGGLKTSRWA